MDGRFHRHILTFAVYIIHSSLQSEPDNALHPFWNYSGPDCALGRTQPFLTLIYSVCLVKGAFMNREP